MRLFPDGVTDVLIIILTICVFSTASASDAKNESELQNCPINVQPKTLCECMHICRLLRIFSLNNGFRQYLRIQMRFSP